MTKNNKNIFELEFEVRDNEVDLQGIVNNANYFIYMAHTRHKHLEQLGISFSEMHKNGYNLLLIETTTKFKSSLKSNDIFIVTSKLEQNGRVRFNFLQDIIRKNDNKIVSSAINTGACIDIKTGRPSFSKELNDILGII